MWCNILYHVFLLLQISYHSYKSYAISSVQTGTTTYKQTYPIRSKLFEDSYMPTVIIDPGHGGMDPGAVYKGRQEKDDNLRLALAVGELLSQNGVDVLYTRTDDVYDSPYRKAMIANESGADYLISFHRNASPIAGNASGIETLVYADRGVSAQMARDINRELAALGFRDIGVIERPGLAVLRRSRMPAVLIETGFIDNDADNLKFDEEFEEIAAAISNGILETLRNLISLLSA